MSTHNIGFYEDLTKIIFELSSNIIKYAPYFFCCCRHLFITKSPQKMCKTREYNWATCMPSYQGWSLFLFAFPSSKDESIGNQNFQTFYPFFEFVITMFFVVLFFNYTVENKHILHILTGRQHFLGQMSRSRSNSISETNQVEINLNKRKPAYALYQQLAIYTCLCFIPTTCYIYIY